MKRKRPILVAPLLPLGFIVVYQVDAAYGTLMQRMRGATTAAARAAATRSFC